MSHHHHAAGTARIIVAPRLPRDLQGRDKPVKPPADRGHEEGRRQVCRRQGPRVRPRQQGMVRRPEPLLVRQVCRGRSRTAPGSTATTAGSRPDGTWRTDAAEAPTVRRLRDGRRPSPPSGRRPQTGARAPDDRAATGAGQAAPEQPPAKAAQPAGPADASAIQAERLQEVFPERRRNAACALHELSIRGYSRAVPPRSTPVRTRAWRT